MSNKKVLFISHDASRTGAPILLLHLAAALKEVKNYEVDFLLINDGVLHEQFKSVGKTHVLWEKKDGSDKTNNDYAYFLTEANVQQYNFILANTVISSYIIEDVRQVYKGIIVTYIHELAAVSHCYMNEILWETLKQCSNLFIVPSCAVKQFLIQDCKVKEEVIGVLPSYIPPFAENNTKEAEEKLAFTVGSSGSTDIRKGVDLFVQVARLFAATYPNVKTKFIWQGGFKGSIEVQLLMKDVAHYGLQDIVFFEGSTNEMNLFYNQLDVFLMLSREDPYPLVVLEAANYNVPCICFSEAGGTPEFVEGNGIVVQYLNLNAVVGAIYSYVTNAEKRVIDGNNARRKLVQVHQDKKAIISILLETVQRVKTPELTETTI